MSFFTLSGDIILMILEELDPLSLFHFCLASRVIHSIVGHSTALRYRYELSLCGMRDGPPGGGYAARDRLLSLLGYKRGWPTLSQTAEDRLRIAPPTIMGVSGTFLFHASQSPFNNGFEWVLHVYELRSFRMAPKPRLPYYQHNVPFDIRKVAIDASQGLMVLAQVYFPPHQNSAIMAVLHIRNLYVCQEHQQATHPRLCFYTDWWGALPPGQRISIEQVQICGSLVAVSIRLELETGEGTTELIVFNWRRGGAPLRTFTSDILFFDLISESRLIILSQPDEDEDDDNGDSVVTTWERKSDGLYTSERGKRPPRISVCDISRVLDHQLLPETRSYEFAEAWNAVSFMQICPNHSLKDNVSQSPGILFYNDPSLRLTAVTLDFQPHAIPSGCSRKMVILFDQSKLQSSEVEDTVRWEDWQKYCMVLNLPDRADAVQLAGRRLAFFENVKDSSTSPLESSSRVHFLDLNQYMAHFLWSLSRTNPPWRWRDTVAAVSTIFDHRGSQYVRTSTVDTLNMTWIDATEDSVVLYDEREGQCLIRILTFGKEVRAST
ncbi:hypothetical protein PAXRUDRAFT_824089 [Paxillus rubicundulus Ve08.2h10]|uniref:F-box domain-containing protein n=1 Tax=Paxillus rubicundulus Ve08.2h10 TaxID=930991 RepID=A0A0D0E2I4_9AGAM|nr:hypothetical protein PAXRUDRAFT_824089 [Paxillus rubicundulus Ve08.2h10]